MEVGDPVQFQLKLKIIDAAFIVRRTPERKFKLKTLLKVFAEAGGATIIDGELKETDVPFLFETEEEAVKYAEDKSREFKLSEFTLINSMGGERRVEL